MPDTRLVHRYSLPRTIVRGLLDSDVRTTIYDEDGTAVTFDSAESYTLTRGSTVIHTTTSITVGLGTGLLILANGIPAVDTASESLSDQWMETWACTIVSQEYTFSRPVYLVRQKLSPGITDTDLTALHSDLLDHIDPDQTTFETQRADAWVMLNKWLIKKGNRPHLILDDWMLRDVHRFLALYIICADFASSVGDGRWSELAHGDKSKGIKGYMEKARDEFDGLSFSYDFDEDGQPEEGERKAANPVTVLQQLAPGSWS